MAAIDGRLAAMLPALRAPGALAGRLAPAAAQALGLPVGVPVSAGGGDNMMSAIGSGATTAGVVVASLGTSGTVFARTETPVVDPRGRIAPFCSSDGAWLPLLCVMNLTGVTEEVKALTGLDHRALTAAAAAVPPGTGGLTLLPFLLGERVPDLPEATGTLLGVRPGLLRPGHLYRAALEGTACNLGAGVDRSPTCSTCRCACSSKPSRPHSARRCRRAGRCGGRRGSPRSLRTTSRQRACGSGPR